MELPSQPEHEDRCSFCNRPAAEAGALTAGLGGAFICHECVDRLFYEQHSKPAQTVDWSVGTESHRFTQRAGIVLALANEEARRFNHNYIGTEHILLGLVAEGQGVAAQVLHNLGVELPTVRNAIEFIIGRGERRVTGEIGLTPRARKVIELAADEARRLGHHYVGTEHLLLGLIREGEGIGAGVLESLAVGLGNARAEVIKVLTQSGEPQDE